MKTLSKQILVQILCLISTMYLFSSCSRHSTLLHTEQPTASPSLQRGEKSQANEYNAYFSQMIEERIKGTNVKKLKDLELKASFEEIRIWVSISPSPLQGVIFQKIDDHWKASFLPPKKTSSNITEIPRRLPPPKSGWDSFWNKMKEMDIYTLPDAEEIKANKIYPDAEGAMVEIRTHNTYRTYIYIGYTFSTKTEPKKLTEIIDFVSQQFGLRLAAR